MEISTMLGSMAGFTLTIPESALGISQSAAVLLVTAVWQGILIALFLAICLKLAPRTTAALRFAIWSAAFAAVAALPFLPIALAQFAATSHSQTAGVISVSSKPWLQLDARWSFLLISLWAIASIIRAIILATDSLRLRRLWRTATPTTHTVSHAEALTIAGRKRVEICTTQEFERPAVIGFFAPRILIPGWLMARLTPGELDQIVLHETEHLRRSDDWTNLLQKLSLVLFPLNPVLLWIEQRLCKEREMACDDGVVRVTRAPRAYAACLTGLAERGLQQRSEVLSLGAWRRRPELVHRVHSILLRKPSLSPAASRGMAAILGCGLIAGSAELARCPQLIAFVPAPHTGAVAKDHVRPTIEAAYTPRNAGIYGSTPSAPHLTQLKAVLPLQTPNPTEIVKTPAWKHQASPASPMTKPLPLSSNELAELDAAANPLANSSNQQRWIVLTTYEQVQSFDQATVSDIDEVSTTFPQGTDKRTGRQAKPDADQKTMQAANQYSRNLTDRGTARMTVTRLVFQVIPATDPSGQSFGKSTDQTPDRGSDRQPAALIPLRSGWFIIQL